MSAELGGEGDIEWEKGGGGLADKRAELHAGEWTGESLMPRIGRTSTGLEEAFLTVSSIGAGSTSSMPRFSAVAELTSFVITGDVGGDWVRRS